MIQRFQSQCQISLQYVHFMLLYIFMNKQPLFHNGHFVMFNLFFISQFASFHSPYVARNGLYNNLPHLSIMWSAISAVLCPGRCDAMLYLFTFCAHSSGQLLTQQLQHTDTYSQLIRSVEKTVFFLLQQSLYTDFYIV